MRKKIVIIIVVALLGLGIWLGQKYYGKTDEDRAVATLKEYRKAQENEKFDLCYTILSSKHKDELKKYSVFNAEDYQEFRESGRLLSSEILKVEKIGKNNINIVERYAVSDEGYIHSGDMTYFMIKENNKWKIDNMEIIPSTYKMTEE